MVAILGPSGVGKSCVCHVLARHHSFLHVEFDRNHPWKSNGFPADWDEEVGRVDFSLVAVEVQARIIKGQRPAAVLSFATIHMFSHEQLVQATAAGITPIILWAAEDQCINARAARSRNNRVRFNDADQNKYRIKNRLAFEAFAGEAYAPYRMEAFQPNGARWPPDHLPEMCRQRMTG
jgi:hypothetical protein